MAYAVCPVVGCGILITVTRYTRKVVHEHGKFSYAMYLTTDKLEAYRIAKDCKEGWSRAPRRREGGR